MIIAELLSEIRSLHGRQTVASSCDYRLMPKHRSLISSKTQMKKLSASRLENNVFGVAQLFFALDSVKSQFNFPHCII
jgi:hypothetical protein